TKLDLTRALDASLPAAERTVELLGQTRRHTLLAKLLRVPSIVFAVNKLDAVADPGPAFAAVAGALQGFADSAGIELAGIVPVSALRGDNVATPIDATWYRGPTLVQLLESLPSSQEQTGTPLSLPVQY
ncbi:GTP-binding protein, partial [Bradyrhizobium sp. NBAIM08]|uniref:GTP-binding protein n=1 Tax=Bradyrhizobium sp. NBAIM08 TaxID=2793815 RepID=UPI0034D224CB|nr:sulfate adenylyltransferase [Bradyrhizobium sp. NBAIM08]